MRKKISPNHSAVQKQRCEMIDAAFSATKRSVEPRCQFNAGGAALSLKHALGTYNTLLTCV